MDTRPCAAYFYNAALCLGLAVGNGWLSAYLSSRVSNRLAILCSIGGLALFLIGVVLVNSPWQMMSCFALCGIVIGLAVTLLTVKISNTAADTIQGEVLGVQLSLRVLGDAIICLFGSALLLLSPKLILIIASAMTFAVMIYYGTRKKNQPKI